MANYNPNRRSRLRKQYNRAAKKRANPYSEQYRYIDPWNGDPNATRRQLRPSKLSRWLARSEKVVPSPTFSKKAQEIINNVIRNSQALSISAEEAAAAIKTLGEGMQQAKADGEY